MNKIDKNFHARRAKSQSSQLEETQNTTMSKRHNFKRHMMKWMMIYRKEKNNKMGKEEGWIFGAGGPEKVLCVCENKEDKPISTPGKTTRR